MITLWEGTYGCLWEHTGGTAHAPCMNHKGKFAGKRETLEICIGTGSRRSEGLGGGSVAGCQEPSRNEAAEGRGSGRTQEVHLRDFGLDPQGIF